LVNKYHGRENILAADKTVKTLDNDCGKMMAARVLIFCRTIYIWWLPKTDLYQNRTKVIKPKHI